MDADRAGELALRCLHDDRERKRRDELVEHYLGGADPAAALGLFVDACTEIIRLRDEFQAEREGAAR
jgi:hypothetical protein